MVLFTANASVANSEDANIVVQSLQSGENKVVLILNFFDELRRIAPAPKK